MFWWRFAIASSSKQSDPDQAQRQASARAFAVEVARLAASTRCSNVVVLDVRNLSPVADFFVLATGTSPRQMRTVCDQIEELGETQGNRAMRVSGTDGESWMLVDFVDVIAHVFSGDARVFYDLDNLWGDAPRVELELTGAAKGQA